MAMRPTFEVTTDERLFVRQEVQFKLFGGFAFTQIQKNIHGLHENYFDGKDFPINPSTYFYNQLYIMTLAANKSLVEDYLQ